MKKIILTIIILISAAALFSGSAQSDNYLKNRIFVEGLYIRNIGNFGNVWSNASGGYLGYGIAFPDHNYLMMRTGIISNKLNDDMMNEDAYLTMIPIEAGGRYYFVDNMFMPFVQFMTGLNLVFTNGDIVGENEAENLVKFAWQVGLGFTINVIENISVDAGVNYQSNFYDDDAMNTGFEYTIGLGYAFGN
ncbi:MAG: outer membrane beta-barrel protein [bacterium]|nr:outer membrane beta-barrel protein [bacterium]